MEMQRMPVEVFYSCSDSPNDAPLREQLERHLSTLQREGWISTWSKCQIAAGHLKQVELERHLNSAALILLLVSSDFLASGDCYVEMQRAWQRYEAGEARIIPVLLRPCDWQSAPFALLEVLPSGAKPVTLWRDCDAAWTDVVRGIRRALGGEAVVSKNVQESSGRDTNNNSSEVSFNGSVSGGQIIGKVTGGQVIYNNYIDNQRDGLRSLEKGAKALWDGEYASAKKELRVAVEEIDGAHQPREAAKARYFFALALLDGKLPRVQGGEVMKSIERLMTHAIRIHPLASYYHIFARVEKDFFEHNMLYHRLEEVNVLKNKGASIPECGDDEEIEKYFRHSQPRLQI